MEREASSPEPVVDSFIYICWDPKYGALPQKVGKTFGHPPWSPTWTESLHTMGCGLASQGGVIQDTAISTSVPCSLQHDTFHLDLGRPEPR